MFRRWSQAAVTSGRLTIPARWEIWNTVISQDSPDSQTRMPGYQLWAERNWHAPLSSSFWHSHGREQAWSWADADTKESKPEGLLEKEPPEKYWPILQEPLKLQTWLPSKSCLWSMAKGSIVIERPLTHMQRLLSLAQASWQLGSPGDHIHPGTQRAGPTLWGGGNSWVEYNTSGANHRGVGKDLGCFIWHPHSLIYAHL